MSEKFLRKKLDIEQEHGAEAPKQSERIFNNVYQQLKESSTREHKTQQQTAVLFRADLADGIEKHISEIELNGLTSLQVYQEIWQRMFLYINKYQNSSRFEKKKEAVTGVYRRLARHVNALVREGEVEPLTAKVFLRALPSIDSIGGHYYNFIVENNESITNEELRAKNQDYETAAEKIWEEQPEEMRHEQSDLGFYHFNNHLVHGGDVKNRIYISAKLSGAPDQVLKAWREALQETGLQHKIYYKIPTGLSRRFETIVLFLTDKTEDTDIEKLFSAFANKCPSALLNERDMPAGIPLRRGISMAPNPSNINTFLRYSGVEQKASYNILVAFAARLSFELACKDAQRKGEEKSTPKSLKDSAGRYFEQIIKLSGINPATMIPNAQGGKLPVWAEKLSKGGV